jgi:response regulator RpfG family c-di-GMP phosphodiesterase
VKQENITNILILAQNENSLMSFKNDLNDAGYHTLTASLTSEGITLITDNNVDMILLDVKMTANDENPFIQALKSLPDMANIPVIVFGAVNNENEIITAFSLGANEYIETPYLVSVMLNRVNNILRFYLDSKATPQCNDNHAVTASNPIQKTYEPSVQEVTNTNDEELGHNANSDSEERFPGIDYNAGVQNVLGDDDLFAEILTMFYEDHAKDKDKIKEAIYSNDYSSCKSLVHTLKGVAGSIGAHDLFKSTKALDAAINLNQEDKYKALFLPVEAELIKVVLGVERNIIFKKD